MSEDEYNKLNLVNTHTSQLNNITTNELYNIIKGKVLFWPNNTEGARMYYTNKSSSSTARKSGL